ncbi:MAG: PadR family transcriptional regulator [Paenibacillaceae bacterium]|nr:PadR family transcriptional regulator [Paenibacillaceae bacterium]
MSMKLVILGLLMNKNRHPYEIRQIIKERDMHHYIKIQDGSLYYAIDQLVKEGNIAVVDVVKDNSNRPDKTIYGITEAGKAKFHELLYENITVGTMFYKPINAALAFTPLGDEKLVVEALEAKIAETEKRVDMLKTNYEEHVPFVPRSSLYIMKGFYEHSLLELDWLRRIHRDAVAGRLREVGRPLEE